MVVFFINLSFAIDKYLKKDMLLWYKTKLCINYTFYFPFVNSLIGVLEYGKVNA